MDHMSSSPPELRFGFVSTRFASTDGVSLETSKWASVLEGCGHHCFYISGKSDRADEISMVVPKAYYRHPEIEARHQHFFGRQKREIEDTNWIHEETYNLKQKLYEFKARFGIDVLMPENCLAIPLHIPLGNAITEFIAETQIPTIAHHHDFYWERKRFLVNNVGEFLHMAFPPALPSIQHVTINSPASQQLAWRKGINSAVIPNVMPFETPPPGVDAYNKDLRSALDIARDQIFVLQPTRVIQRKGIEHSIELLSRLEMDAVLVISHATGDEGYEYENRLRNYAEMLGVSTRFAADLFDEKRGETSDGRKIYSLWDAYPHADLVTYPSLIEGFGNAFLESVYFKKPILVNNYPIFAVDIRTKGFQVIEFNDFITKETVETTRRLLTHPEECEKMTAHNYGLALKYYSFQMLKTQLQGLINKLVI